MIITAIGLLSSAGLSEIFQTPDFNYLISPVKLQHVNNVTSVALNENLLREMGIWQSAETQFGDAGNVITEIASGGQNFFNKYLIGLKPYSRRYAGTQFGYFSNQLGDGRAASIGITTLLSPNSELQIKGSGQTPYSRRGDGRCTLLSCVREYIASEYINLMGIPTTRALAITLSKNTILRDELYNGNIVPVPQATVLRSSDSFIRFGTFELVKVEGHDKKSLKELFNEIVMRYYPNCKVDESNTGICFFNQIVKRSATLVASWKATGFTHSVMNTDNLSIIGLTIDYGPFSFMEFFNKNHISNYIDDEERYAFDKQSEAMLFSLRRLSDALSRLNIISKPDAEDSISAFNEIFEREYETLMASKLLLTSETRNANVIIKRLLEALQESSCDYTTVMRSLGWVTDKTFLLDFVTKLADSCPDYQQRRAMSMRSERIRKQFFKYPDARMDFVGETERAVKITDLFRQWKFFFKSYQRSIVSQLARSGMSSSSYFHHRMLLSNSTNPMFIPRNGILRDVSESAALGDFTPLSELIEVLSDPFDKITTQVKDVNKYIALPDVDGCLDLVSCGS